MKKEIQLFITIPELLLVGNNDGIMYDRDKFLVDGIQRTTILKKFNKKHLVKSILNNKFDKIL